MRFYRKMTPSEFKRRYEQKDCDLTFDDIAEYADCYLGLPRPARTYPIWRIFDLVTTHAGVQKIKTPDQLSFHDNSTSPEPIWTTKEKVEIIKRAIYRACPYLRDGIEVVNQVNGGTVSKSKYKKIHLEHLLRAIGRVSDQINRETERFHGYVIDADGTLTDLAGTPILGYDLSISFEHNMENDDRVDALYRILARPTL
jgi:hypothetical protein